MFGIRVSGAIVALTYVFGLAACSDDDGGGADDADANIIVEPDAALGPDAGDEADAAVEPECGSEHLPAAQITGTEGLAIAPDGTLYYSQDGAVGRRRPGMAPENTWVAVPNTKTIYGLAFDDESRMLYVAAVSSATIFKIDTAAASPEATVLYSPASGANGLIIGPDGAVYYSGGGKVYRVDLQGARTEVTASSVSGANGLFFESPTTLLVLAYSQAKIFRLTLNASMHETARDTAATVTGNNVGLDGIARDEQGRWYIGDNGADRLVRFQPDWTGQETLVPGISAAANVVFGRGALDCADVYVASGGELGVYHIE
jgi:sugar lactone lactonase YvrE